jgi:hypothetical protein
VECPENLDLGLFTEQTCYILSVKILVSDMLARRYPRGTAGRAVSVAPIKLARTLILIMLGILGLNFAGQGCDPQKSTYSFSLELTKVPLAGHGGPDRLDTIEGRVVRTPPRQQIALWARWRPWWAQSWPDRALISIRADSTWSTETHLGFEQAVLLVDPEYHPLPTLDVAPTQGGPADLVKVVKGTGTPQFAAAGSLKFSGYDRVLPLENWQMEGLGL